MKGRGGMMVAPGKEAAIGYWPDNLTSSKSGWVGQAFKEYAESLRIAQRYHEQNLEIVKAQQLNKAPTLPDLTTRQQRARADQKRLAQIQSRLAKLDGEVFDRKIKLRPFEYDRTDTVGALNRQELRAHMRTMTNEQRRDALKKFEYRQAALESLPELSGLGPTQHDTLREEILAKAFPEDIAGIKDGTSALEIAERARAAATAAIENELKAAGSTVEEPLPPAEPKPWI
jgi:hypothetical protein